MLALYYNVARMTLIKKENIEHQNVKVILSILDFFPENILLFLMRSVTIDIPLSLFSISFEFSLIISMR